MLTQCYMQNCPLAAVKIHAKQTRDGNNRRNEMEGGGVGMDGGDETDGELDSQSEEEEEMSSCQ